MALPGAHTQDRRARPLREKAGQDDHDETADTGVAAAQDTAPDALRSPSVLIHAVLAVVLLLATLLAVYKPRGRIRYAANSRPATPPS